MAKYRADITIFADSKEKFKEALQEIVKYWGPGMMPREGDYKELTEWHDPDVTIDVREDE